MTDTVRTRFAPSPTGSLHIGGARTALFNWLFAKKHGGTFVLRIEDTDEKRSTSETVDQILDSLGWLGLDWDEGPDGGDLSGKGEFGPYHQMHPERRAHYKKYVEELLQNGKAYKCYCTPEELDAMRKKAAAEKKSLGYDGRCRDLTEDQRKEREAQGRGFSVRFKMPREGVTVVPDLIRGNVEFENKLLQDLVLQKTGGGPTYNFACVVDDHLMRITHVIRGDDHLSNTPSQMRIYAALGWEAPQFGHLSMIHGPDGKKLSKRHGAASVGEYRDMGYLPETVRNYLALLGWSTSDSQQIFASGELESKFSMDGAQRSPARFDVEKLTWMNGEYLRKKTPEAILESARPFLKKEGLGDAPDERLLPLIRLEIEKFHLLPDVPKRLDFFFKDVVFDEKAERKVLKKEGVTEILEGIAGLLETVEPFDEATLEKSIRAFCEEKGLKTGKVFHPVRVSVSGRTNGPTLFGMLELLGKDAVVGRIRGALARTKVGAA